jgi:hypothetical protein
MPETPTTLDYSRPDGPSHRARRLIVIGAIILALAIMVFRFGSPVRDQLRLLRQQSQWLNHLDPPDTIIYEEDPAEGAKLLATGKYDRLPYGGTFAGTDWDPVALRANQDKPWSVCLYEHRATSRAGNERSINVHCQTVNEEELGHGRVMKLSAMVMKKATFWPGSRLKILTASEIVLLENLGGGDYVRFYAGQPDPADPAHFTIRYQFNNKPGVIDGRLNEDDTITLVKKESAAK